MFARFVMFALCLLAGWLIWRALRRWIDMRSERPGGRSEVLRLGDRRDEGSPAGWMAAGGSGVGIGSDRHRIDENLDTRTTNGCDALQADDYQQSCDGQSGDSGGDSSDGGSGSSD